MIISWIKRKLGDLDEIVKYHSLEIVDSALSGTERVIANLNKYAADQTTGWAAGVAGAEDRYRAMRNALEREADLLIYWQIVRRHIRR
jgi:hypothetical protein